MISPEDFGIAPQPIYSIVFDEISPVFGLKILDIPCGSGGYSIKMDSEGALCFAVDRAEGVKHRPAVIADMNNALPFLDESFDVIICIEGIEHIFNSFHLISEFHRLLKPCGKLVITTPNIQSLRSRLKFLLRGTFYWFDIRVLTGLGHVNPVPFFILRHILKLIGFDGISVRASKSIFPVVPGVVCKIMQKVFSKPSIEETEQNSSVLLNAANLIVSARKPLEN